LGNFRLHAAYVFSLYGNMGTVASVDRSGSAPLPDLPLLGSSLGYIIDPDADMIDVQDSPILGQKCFLVQSRSIPASA
jgi:hypothetical protein